MSRYRTNRQKGFVCAFIPCGKWISRCCRGTLFYNEFVSTPYWCVPKSMDLPAATALELWSHRITSQEGFVCIFIPIGEWKLLCRRGRYSLMNLCPHPAGASPSPWIFPRPKNVPPARFLNGLSNPPSSIIKKKHTLWVCFFLCA